MIVSEITKDFLIQNGASSGYTDHVAHFDELFKAFKPKGLIECGVGYSTKYFLDYCTHVTSIEFINNGFGDSFMYDMKELYKNIPNWKGLTYQGSDQLYWAETYRSSQHNDPELIDPTYLKELKELFAKQLSEHDFNIAFVDSGVYIRGDFVELFLQNNIPIVVAHDFNLSDGTCISQYGWDKVKSTDKHERILIPTGNNTCFWIRNDLKEVISKMNIYKESVK